MEFIRYTPSHYELLLQRRDDPHFPQAFHHREFVDWYYTSSGHCHLALFLEKGELAGCIGVELMRFESAGRPLQVAASNNHVAFLPGIGGLQLLYWMRAAPYSMVFGGSQETHAILRQHRWHYFPPVPILLANRKWTYHGHPWHWRNLVKRGVALLWPPGHLAEERSAIRRQGGESLQVREVSRLEAEMLPRVSPFHFRLAPSVDYLRWRYDTTLRFVHYRLFCISNGLEQVGYVIVQESQERILVSQCDGNDVLLLSCGILLALADLTEHDRHPREMQLSCCHPEMQRIFLLFGFHNSFHPRPFVMGAQRGELPMAHNTRHWLVNFDWNDNGLRPPFSDRENHYGG
ncbi:hypothetical protein [Candidatus Magnetaquicoccus inordinatus]|uniref:hypothetical protein n=1 Tax=Candidatus Magnetaquicoccus inordinatus TaxID=2496818 RepID=UPI00102B2055|nr:hypothetical protein [Candidatus Magnetaquicoccus inordinatus]